ncbi:MAG: hypothetical protein JO287_09105 [Pseudonocardiales bacterium]|nr:hypothetical protein [Pseudonocardiales bacterium]
MATWQARHDNTVDEPVTCALGSADRAAQADRWKQIAKRAMTRRAQAARGIRISFRNDPGVEDSLRQLAAVESRCCAWATWTVEGMKA